MRSTPPPIETGGAPREPLCDGRRTVAARHSANNQHNLASEIVQDLAQTSFARAMGMAKGTVSVVDSSAKCFERIW